jgi:hypothetical protein
MTSCIDEGVPQTGMMSLLKSRWMGALAVIAASFLAGPAARAQCVLCYLSASSTGDRGASVLRAGILVLLIPTVLIFGGVILLALRRRDPAGLGGEAAEDGQASEENAGGSWASHPARRDPQHPSPL